MESILDIIYDYSKKRKLLDSKSLEIIIKLFMKENNIDIIKKINIIQKKEILLGNVSLGNYLDDYINIYYSRIIVYLNNYYHISDFLTEDELILYEEVFRNNLFITFIIFHELEHSMQEQIVIDNKNEDFETRLIELESFYLNNLGNKVLSRLNYYPETGEYDFSFLDSILYTVAYFIDDLKYNRNYNISYLERLADLNANKKIIDMIKPIKNEIPHLYKLENELLLDRAIRDYDKSKISPTIDFFNNLLGKRYFNYQDMPDYDFDNRLRLGLPISDKEYNSISKKLKKQY